MGAKNVVVACVKVTIHANFDSDRTHREKNKSSIPSKWSYILCFFLQIESELEWQENDCIDLLRHASSEMWLDGAR